MDKIFKNDSQISVNPAIMEQLSTCERQWLNAGDRLISLRARMVFWFGDNSGIMWLLAQMLTYVVAAMLLMLAAQTFDWEGSLRNYLLVFGVLTAIFVGVYQLRGRLAEHLQRQIDKYDQVCEQALTEMYRLAAQSILPDIHSQAPLSLRAIEHRYHHRLQLVSLQLILQKEIEKGRLLLNHQEVAKYLPPQFAEFELVEHANQMIYKSLLRPQD